MYTTENVKSEELLHNKEPLLNLNFEGYLCYTVPVFIRTIKQTTTSTVGAMEFLTWERCAIVGTLSMPQDQREDFVFDYPRRTIQTGKQNV